jgi:hypothetical protein
VNHLISFSISFSITASLIHDITDSESPHHVVQPQSRSPLLADCSLTVANSSLTVAKKNWANFFFIFFLIYNPDRIPG